MVESQVLLVLQHHQDLILVFKLLLMINITGIITVTNKVYGFPKTVERPNTVKLKNLEFSCVGYSGVTTTIFQDHERPQIFLVGIVSDRTFEVQVGVTTTIFQVQYIILMLVVDQGGGHAFEFFEDLTFGSGYRGGSVAIGVTDQAYEHRFVSAGIGSIRKGNFAAYRIKFIHSN